MTDNETLLNVYTKKMGGRFGSSGVAPDFKRCRAWVRGDYSRHQCGNKGKHEEAGFMWCGHHLPSKVKLKRKQRDKKWKRQWARSTAARAVFTQHAKVATTAISMFDQKASWDDLEKEVAEWRKLDAYYKELHGENG